MPFEVCDATKAQVGIPCGLDVRRKGNRRQSNMKHAFI